MKLKKLTTIWQRSDWEWRIVTFAAAIFLLIAAIFLTSFSHMNGKKAMELTAARGELLGSWLSDNNRAALVEGRPELAELESVASQPFVRKAIIFGPEGKVFAPISMYGDSIGDKELFAKVRSSSKSSNIFGKDGRLEIFMPVVSEKDIYGVIYLELDGYNLGWGIYAAGITLMIGALLAIFVHWLIRETTSSAHSLKKDDAKKRFDVVKELLDSKLDERERDVRSLFESEWRRLVHIISEPVMVMDKGLRLVEINDAAVKCFGGNGRASEGRHIVDVLEKDKRLKSIIRMLSEVSAQPENMIRSEEDGTLISIFSLKTDRSNFKYTMICSENGGAE